MKNYLLPEKPQTAVTHGNTSSTLFQINDILEIKTGLSEAVHIYITRRLGKDINFGTQVYF